MRITVIIFLLVLLASCSNRSKKRLVNSDVKEVKPVTMIDTINTSFPLQIGNDKGSVKIIGIRTFKDKKLTNSDFVISLIDIPNVSISRQIDKCILIDSNETVLLKDTLNADFLESAIIKTIEFDFVRSNSLYFNAVLENTLENKEIAGRFNLFYRTNKKGTIYGWITDEIKETLHKAK